MHTALSFLALFSCFYPIEGTPLEAGEKCVGIRREDAFYDFELPNAVALNVQNPACDAEWSLDQFTAILDGNSIYFSHPFKNVTRQGITVSYCPSSVRFHVSCPIYTNEFTCSCTNFTSTPVPSTSLRSRASFTDEVSPFDLKTTERQYYCAIAVAAFVITLVVLAFLICRTNRSAKYAPTRSSADEQNQPCSA